MTIVIETKLAASLKEKLGKEDERAAEHMAAGTMSYEEYKTRHGYRKGLQAAQTLLAETLEEIMKE